MLFRSQHELQHQHIGGREAGGSLSSVARKSKSVCDGLRWFLGRIGLLQAYPFYGKTDSFLLVDTKTLKAHAAGFSVRVEAKLDDRGCISGRPLVAPLLDGIDG